MNEIKKAPRRSRKREIENENEKRKIEARRKMQNDIRQKKILLQLSLYSLKCSPEKRKRNI